jgi:hypothetical protein
MHVRRGSWLTLRPSHWVAALAAALLIAGCQPPGNDNGNGNSNSNSNQNGNTNDNSSNSNVNGNSNANANGNDNASTNGEFTAEQKVAVNAVQESFVAVPGVLTGVSSLDSVRDPQQIPDEQSSFFDCPQVTLDHQGNIYSITLDYGDSCTNGAWGDVEFSGSATGSYDVGTRTFAFTYEDYTVDGESIDGTVTLAFDFSSNGGGWSLNVDITNSSGEAADGTLTVQFTNSNGLVEITTADLILTKDGVSYTVVGEGLLINPSLYSNIVPYAGTYTFEIPHANNPSITDTIVVTFDEDSPVDGTVTVVVNGGPPHDHTLDGF